MNEWWSPLVESLKIANNKVSKAAISDCMDFGNDEVTLTEDNGDDCKQDADS
jgi:hypothetical protein